MSEYAHSLFTPLKPASVRILGILFYFGNTGHYRTYLCVLLHFNSGNYSTRYTDAVTTYSIYFI